MDSFELNKIAGAILSALLVVFGTRTAMEIAFKPHGLDKPAYVVAVTEKAEGGAAEGGGGVARVPLAIVDLLKLAKIEQGKEVFKKCAACHSAEKGVQKATGPSLYNVVGRVPGSTEFAYSEAMKKKGGAWTFEALQAYLYDPKTTVPGNKMAFLGVKENDDLGSVILYLRSLADAPAALPQ